MRQRIMIAIALACDPKLIIADEPTTALDVTIQAQILELMQKLTRRLGVALIIITHNLGVVARYAQRVNVMYAGRIVESGTAAALYHDPHHPYTMALLRSVPRLDRPRQARLDPIEGQPPDLTRLDRGCSFRPRCRFAIEKCAEAPPPLVPAGAPGQLSACFRSHELDIDGGRRHDGRERRRAQPLLQVRGLRMHFPVTEGMIARRHIGDVKAVDGVDLAIRRGETLGLVGESGCGKTTMGRCILRLEKPTAGEILYDGVDIAKLGRRELVALRRRIQVIFQDPYSSLNPRQKVGSIIGEPMMVHGVEPDPRRRAERVRELLSVCGLNPNFADRYPHEMSGGQRQRVGIARALALNPEFIVCDEAVSALDVSIQAQIINLLEDLRDKFNLTYLFIAHDLSVVRHLCQRVAVMYLGRVVELAECDELFDNPLHPYTKALLAAVPVPDPAVEADARVSAGAGRGAEPDQPAARLRLSPALPAGGRAMQAGAAGTARIAPRPLGGLRGRSA